MASITSPFMLDTDVCDRSNQSYFYSLLLLFPSFCVWTPFPWVFSPSLLYRHLIQFLSFHFYLSTIREGTNIPITRCNSLLNGTFAIPAYAIYSSEENRCLYELNLFCWYSPCIMTAQAGVFTFLFSIYLYTFRYFKSDSHSMPQGKACWPSFTQEQGIL